MPKVIVEQFIKEVETDEIEPMFRFSYIVKLERRVSKGRTETKISYRDTRDRHMDYKLIHETIEKEDYKKFVNFFKKRGYNKL